jgi:hypothetical protein
VLALALVAGSFAFLTGLGFLGGLAALSDDPEERLFEVNLYLGTAVVMLSLGGFLVYQAASSLGDTTSGALTLRTPWFLVPVFPVLVLVGQYQATHPERLPWLFPFVNLGIVSIPSVFIALLVARRYLRSNLWPWPISWRESSSGFAYGAIGATTIAGVINTIYLYAGAWFFVDQFGHFDAGPLDWKLRGLPTGWGIVFDLSVLSVVAPFNEEFWKGALVALFFFRKGGAARCFVWGVLAGAGFNLFETFFNSLSLVNPQQIADQTLGNEWWLFALARAGTSSMHALASGLAALGFFGLLRRRWRYVPGYLAGVLLHGSWNASVYLIYGDIFLSQAGPDSLFLDALGAAALVTLGCGALLMLWFLAGELRDGAPAPIYRMLGMVPAGGGEPAGVLPSAHSAGGFPQPAFPHTRIKDLHAHPA